MNDRRSTDIPWGDPARILAILYTAGYFWIVYLMMTRQLPEGSEGAINQLIGGLTIVQAGIIKFYFDGSKAAEKAQLQIAASKDRSDIVMQEIAKAAPMPAIIPTPAPAVPAEPPKEAIP